MGTKNTFRGTSIDVMLEHNTETTPLLHTQVSSKHFSKAVMRNKIKRWCREAWKKSTLARPNTKTTARVKKGSPDFSIISADFKNAERAFE